MSDLIFDAPWWFPVLIFTVGVFVFVSGNRRQNDKTRNAGMGILLLGVLIVVLTIFVDTPKKIARRETKQLIESAVTGDWTTFQSLLAPNASLRMMGSPSLCADAKQLTAVAQEGTSRVHLKAAHIRSLETEQNGSLVTVSVGLMTEQETAEAPIMQSAWQFDFRKAGSDWRVAEIRATQIGEMSAEDAQHFVK
jgi:hypothetical protein